MRRNKRWIRAGALLALLTWGCQTFTPISPSELPRAPEVDGDVRVTMMDGRQVLYQRARVEGERIVGETEFGVESVPIDEVASLESRELSETRVVLFTLGATVILGALIIGFVSEDNPPAPGGS